MAWGRWGGGLVREGREREERGRMTALTSGYIANTRMHGVSAQTGFPRTLT